MPGERQSDSKGDSVRIQPDSWRNLRYRNGPAGVKSNGDILLAKVAEAPRRRDFSSIPGLAATGQG
jgi:hypothetical protein